MTNAQATAPDESEEAPSPGISPLEVIRFVLASARRHLILGVALTLLVGSGGVAFALAIPPLYAATSKTLVTQSALVTPALSNPHRTMPKVDPMQGASDIVLRKNNLEVIVRETDLPTEWDRTRPPHLRFKDWARSLISGEMTSEDKVHALVDLLETRLMVISEGTTAVRITAFWSDPEMAVKLANLATKRFLDYQRAQETSVITAAIEILEREVEKSAKAIEPELEAVQRVRDRAKQQDEAEVKDAKAAKAAKAADAPAPRTVMVRQKTKPKPALEDPSLSLQLTQIREAIRRVQEPWQRRLTELKLQKNDLLGVYGPQHPAVVQQEARIAQASPEPPELDELRARERELLAKTQSVSPEGETRLVAVPGRPFSPAGAAVDDPQRSLITEEAPEVAAARSKLMAAISKYNDFADRLDTARVELTTAETAFDYRFVEVAKPERQRKPVKPNRPVLIAGAVAAALALGLLAGAVRELITGRVVDVWQARMLGIPVLAELPAPKRLQG